MASSARFECIKLEPNPRMAAHTNSAFDATPCKCESALTTMPALVVSTTAESCAKTQSSALKKYSLSQLSSFICNSAGCFLSHALTMHLTSDDSWSRKIMPIRETVAGEANLRSWVSKMKLTFGPNWMRSPEGIVSSRLSSRTELRDSTHSGSMSPSQMIQLLTSGGSRTTLRADAVSTPSNHSRVSMSI